MKKTKLFFLICLITIFFVPKNVAGNLIGLWNFDDSLTNSLAGGSPLVILGSPTTSYINETINGNEAKVLQFSAFSSFSQQICMTNDAAKPTRSYTLVFDVKFPVINSYTALFDMDEGTDAEFFIRSNGDGIGISGQYDGTINQDTWYRIAVVCEYDGATIDMTKYINGSAVGTQNDLDASRFSISDTMGYFTDNAAETSAGMIGSLAFYDDVKDSTFISNLGGPTSGGIGSEDSIPPKQIGLWNFNDSLTNSVGGGAPLVIAGSPSTSYADETINGNTARVLQFPAFSNSQWITMTNEASAHAYMEEYTLIFDIKFSGGRASFFQNDISNARNASFFLNTSQQIGLGAGSYHGTFKNDTWYRMALTIQADESGGLKMRKYIDGINIGGTLSYTDSNTNRLILHDLVLLLTDENAETHSGAINSFAFYDGIKNDTFISELGGPTAAGIGSEDPESNDLGPYVKYVDPYSVKVCWFTDKSVPSTIEYGLTNSLDNAVGDGISNTVHEVYLTNLQCRTKYYYRVNKSDGYGDTFKFDTSLNYSRVNVSNTVSPYTIDLLTPKYEEAAENIISETGIEKGYCLVYGCGNGRLAFELAKRSDMIIVGVDTDEAAIKDGRQKLISAGVYGCRVTLHKVASLSSLKYSKWLFNLIVSDTMIANGSCPGDASEVFRVLRPSGGIGYFGQPTGCPNSLSQSSLESWLNAASLSYTTTNDSSGLWSKVVREELADAGEWPQQNGRVDNAANSGDTLYGKTTASEMQVQWIGSPGADFGADRNPRMPAPVMSNGRVYHQGFDRVISIDSYNGFIYWSMEVPDILRVNMPKDGSIMCADKTGLFIGYKNTCWQLDGPSGELSQIYEISNPDYEWGYVARAGDKLYGTAQYKDAHYNNIWGGPSWYEKKSGDQTYKVCSKEIFACNTNTTARVWTYSDGVIINATITIGSNRIYFVESRDPTVTNYTSGRVGLPELWNSQYLVALDLDTGTKLWEQSINTEDGIDVIYMQYTDEKLFITISRDKYYIYAYNAANGSSIWSANHAWHHGDHSGHQQHPVIAGSKLYLVPNSYNINTGAKVNNDVGIHNKCGTYSGCDTAILYRGDASVNMVMQDISGGGGGSKSSWKWLRNSCWLSMIFGGQMILAPEGAGGCSCNGWINTSLGFVPED